MTIEGAIAILKGTILYLTEEEAEAIKTLVREAKLPTNEPQGKWIKKYDAERQANYCVCSSCGDKHILLMNYFLDANFCPKCGTPMTEEAMKILEKRNKGEAE